MIERTADGWLISTDNGIVKLSPAWLEDMYRHAVKPRQAKVAGRLVPAEGEAEWHRLHHAVTSGESEELIEELFHAFYSKYRSNYLARRSTGLKWSTRDGDEDLRAVLDGAPVRQWNRAKRAGGEDGSFDDFKRRARANRD